MFSRFPVRSDFLNQADLTGRSTVSIRIKILETKVLGSQQGKAATTLGQLLVVCNRDADVVFTVAFSETAFLEADLCGTTKTEQGAWCTT